MIHQGSAGFRGNTPDVMIQVREVEELNKRLNGILARHTGQDEEKIARETERDFFMSPEQAKAYGIIDEVYAERAESLISQAKHAGVLAGEGAAIDSGERVSRPTTAFPVEGHALTPGLDRARQVRT